MRSRTIVAFVALALAACGPGVNDLSRGSEPLAYATGRIDVAAYSSRADGKPLRAVLAWAGLARTDAACLKYASNEKIRAACGEPLAFSPGLVEPSVELEPAADGTFRVPIMRLPGASVAIGTPAGRIAYGSILVLQDANANGAIEYEQSAPDGTVARVDRILGASFATLAAPQGRLAFREGAFDEKSFYYPMFGCGSPPPGFSTALVPPLVVPPPAQADCSFGGIERALDVPIIDDAAASSLECRSRIAGWGGDFWPVSTNRPFDELPPDTELECLDAETAIIEFGPPDDTRLCPMVFLMKLKGCWDDGDCKDPDWDLTKEKPGYWTCK